jgi:ligand-binding sensor domain-containing protein
MRGDDVVEPRTGQSRPTSFYALHADRNGTIWAGTEIGVSRLTSDLRTGAVLVARTYSMPPGTETAVGTIDEDMEGAIWFGTVAGLARIRDGKLKIYSTANGLTRTR